MTDSFKGLVNMVELKVYLWGTCIGDDGVQPLAESLASLTKCQILHLFLSFPSVLISATTKSQNTE